MPKAQSDTKPSTILKLGSKIYVNYNIIEETVTNEYGTKVVFNYEYVTVGNIERSTLINAIMLDKYSKADEIAFINNKFRGKYTDVTEYNDYQTFRSNVKSIVDNLLK